jgi:hypothetical protein
MDHQRYETWLLNDERLTPEQDRDLRGHLRNCVQCAALARANLSLRSAPVVAPAEGFALRFQVRLAGQRTQQRRYTLIGLTLLGIIGAGGLIWLFFPYLAYLALPPAQLVSLWLSNLIYLATTVRALGVLADIIINVLGSFIPVYMWILVMALLVVVSSLWVVSFRRFGKTVQSAV